MTTLLDRNIHLTINFHSPLIRRGQGGGGWNRTLQGPKADSTTPTALATTHTKLTLLQRERAQNARGKTARHTTELSLQGCNERKPTLDIDLPCAMHTGN